MSQSDFELLRASQALLRGTPYAIRIDALEDGLFLRPGTLAAYERDRDRPPLARGWDWTGR